MGTAFGMYKLYQVTALKQRVCDSSHFDSQKLVLPDTISHSGHITC